MRFFPGSVFVLLAAVLMGACSPADAPTPAVDHTPKIAPPLRDMLDVMGVTPLEAERMRPLFTDPKTGFRMQVEFPGNDELILIHVSERLTEGQSESRYSSAADRSPLFRDLTALRGVEDVTLQSYSITVERATVFTREELIAELEAVVKKHVKPGFKPMPKEAVKENPCGGLDPLTELLRRMPLTPKAPPRSLGEVGPQIS
jgi:hypothetical protein